MASLPRGLVLDLNFDGDEGDGFPYYYAHVKPAPGRKHRDLYSLAQRCTSGVCSIPSSNCPCITDILGTLSASDRVYAADVAGVSHPGTEYDGELLDKICPADLVRLPCQFDECATPAPYPSWR
jgi:hypothetical protein